MGAEAWGACLSVGGRNHVGPRRHLPRPLLDRGGLSFTRSPRDPHGPVRLRADRGRRADTAARRSRVAGPCRRRCRRALRLPAVRRGAVRDDLQGRRGRRSRGANRLRHHALAALWHLRRGPGLRRRFPQSRDHRQRAAQYAGPVRLSAGYCRRHPDGHPRARVVDAGLGCAGGFGAVDRDLDAGRSRTARVALGRALPGGPRRALRLGVVATHPGARESPEGRAGAGLGLASGHRRLARIGDCAGFRSADDGLARAGSARGRNPGLRALDAALPVRGRTRAGAVAGGAGLVVVDGRRRAGPLGRRPVRLAGNLLRRPLCGSRFCAAVECAAAGLLGGALGLGRALAFPVRLVCAAGRVSGKRVLDGG